MLQESQKSISQIQRSLNRLDYYLQQQDIQVCVPAFYYTANLLNKYAEKQGNTKVKQIYFIQFKQELEKFINRGITYLKPKSQEILQETFQIVQSELFTNCLRPDIYSSKINHQHRSDLPENQKILTATQSYNFNIPTPILEQGLGNSKIKLQKNISQESSKILENKKSQNSLPLYRTNQILKKQWQKLQLTYKQHIIDDAYFKSKQFLKKINKQQLLKIDQNFLDTIQFEYNTMINFYKQFDQTGWIFDKQQNGITLEYKLFQQLKQISIKIQGQSDFPIDNFLAIVSQVDLMGQYVPFTYDSRLVKSISRNQNIGTSKVYIPCLTDRETYFYAVGYDRISTTNSIFLYSKTVNDDYMHQKKYDYHVPTKSDYVRLDYKFFIVQYIPLGGIRAKIRLASNVDLKLNFLPNFILSLSARRFAFDYFKNIIKINKNFKGSEWEKRVKANPGLYNFFKQKIEEYLSKGKIN